MNPLAGIEATVGKDMLHKIQTSKILLVGGGGIGCELLKDLSLSGFRRVEVIDLDTIDISNLNRQLLFRSQHVGMPKCTVGCQVAHDMVPELEGGDSDNLPKVMYKAHHGNVCDASKFHVPFIQQFNLVLNALDNVEARRRVNRLCLAASVPLVEAGTTGYLGQVTVIHKPSQVACYECKTQETQKVYPICTIRSTPSMPVHTIVWGKELYKLLFHSKEGESMLYEDLEGEEPSTYMESVMKLRKLLWEEDTDTKAIKATVEELLRALYVTEIQKQLDMGRYKAAKKTPTPLSNDTLQKGCSSTEDCASASTTNIWSTEHCVAQVVDCVSMAAKMPRNEVLESFDKDDDMAMRFVTATSNMRSHVFGIDPLQSLYSAKGIAGNIIPAIATTNAICAGLQVLQCFKILREEILKEDNREGLDLKDICKYINCIRNKTRNGLYITASQLEPPNPNCFVCKNANIPLTLNVDEFTLELFLKLVLKKRLGFEEPTIILGGDFIWEEGDGADAEEYEPNLKKTLSKLPCGGIQHGSVLEVDDASQNLTIQVTVTHQDVWEGDEVDDNPFIVGDAPPHRHEPPEKESAEPAPAAAAKPTVEEDDDDDDIIVMIDEDEAKGSAENGDKKRPAQDVEAEPPAKRTKTSLKKIEVIEID
mmetsp:Transcript_484/g.758  ORF Transcript_484/g.758 Transcript_484/m.758 type:complete len:650 (+) Transcript_484:227-2176(+)|eukprot:CAMPEP_0113625602 /NCGR_PEP_ID=MMETSP0017_2-20120614/13227_1 /TAXON_ID=2856 /ORGANISM="Cylindrotheca closterium" /LENGTH=649 /DNA_ID=CAMNT_0000535727 /DNA_START=106 /DNA_END=2055 /DNA_ORIENTATION=+ /assembly_acc=CAM_ASM_000147